MWCVIDVASPDGHNILLQMGTLYYIVNYVYAEFLSLFGCKALAQVRNTRRNVYVRRR